MNQNKVAFIICANDEHELNECVGYLDRLILPDGFEKDVISIAEAPSMAAGYNAGMHSSDAKYKVYIHQDTFIINQHFIFDMLEVFADKEVGLFGMVGTRKMPRDAYAIAAWDTGKVQRNYNYAISGFQEDGKIYTEVEAVDGLLLATQYDIGFREDLFKNWDFYDISACYEYRRAGYKVVVPYQQDYWVYHDDKQSSVANYDSNRKTFVKEYSRDFALDETIKEQTVQELEQVRMEAMRHLEKLIDEGKIREVAEVLLGSDEFNFQCFRDIRLLAEIYQDGSSNVLFDWSGHVKENLLHLYALKWFLKRVEYDVAMGDEEYSFFVTNYSVQVILLVCVQYCIKKKTVMRKVCKYVGNREIVRVLEKNLTDEMDFSHIIKTSKSNLIYHEESLGNKKHIVIIDCDLQDNRVLVLLDTLKKRNILSNIIIFARANSGYITEYIEAKVPVVISEGPGMAKANVMSYLSACEWKVQEVIYLGNDAFVNTVREVMVNSGIKEVEFEECVQEVYGVKRMEEETEFPRKVSIIILSYNTLELTKRCIESIRNTIDKERYELVLVDNASTDGSAEYLKTLSGVKVICNTENKGFAGGCNQGLEIAEKDNDIWLLNSDTLVPEYALFWLQKGLYERDDIGACGSVSNFCPNYQNIVEIDVTDQNYQEIAKKYNRYMKNALEEKNWLVGFSMLIKRSALEEIGYLDERFYPGNYEDNDLSYRLLQAGYKLMLCHNSFVFHYGSQSFKKTNTVSTSLIENKQRFVEKWKFDPEKYTAIKTRHIAMIDKKRGTEFSVLDMNAGVGATLARLEYMYPRIFVAGMEDNAKVAEIARLNGHLIDDKFDRKFDYVLCDSLSESAIERAKQYLKEHGTFISRCHNRYYQELINDGNEERVYSGEEMLDLLERNSFEVKDISFARGRYSDIERINQLCKKYSCAENLIVAEWFYFVARKIDE